MNHKLAERLEELQQDYNNAVADHNYALANQLDMEINYLLEHEKDMLDEDI